MRVLYTVKNGGIVVTTDPSAKVSVIGRATSKVDVGRRVIVVLVVPLLWVRIIVTEAQGSTVKKFGQADGFNHRQRTRVLQCGVG